MIDALEPADRDGQAALRAPRHPGLGDPRAVPAVHPAGLGHRAVGQARALGRDGRRGRRRGGRRPPAVPLAEGLRRATSSTASPPSRSRPASPSRSRTCIPWRASSQARRGDVPARLGPLRRSPTPTPRSTSRTPRSRPRDPIAMADRLGDRLRHVHLTDGTGSAKDEHLVPGPRHRSAPRSSCGTSPRTGFARRDRGGDQHPQVRPPAPSARPTCASRWSSPASTSSAARAG